MKRFWVSWHQPTEDERPLTFPPNEAILGWWRSGYSCDHERDLPVVPIICALVEAENEDEVRAAVLRDWPEAETDEWRIFRDVGRDWLPPADRFPPSEWMVRLSKALGNPWDDLGAELRRMGEEQKE